MQHQQDLATVQAQEGLQATSVVQNGNTKFITGSTKAIITHATSYQNLHQIPKHSPKNSKPFQKIPKHSKTFQKIPKKSKKSKKFQKNSKKFQKIPKKSKKIQKKQKIQIWIVSCSLLNSIAGEGNAALFFCFANEVKQPASSPFSQRARPPSLISHSIADQNLSGMPLQVFPGPSCTQHLTRVGSPLHNQPVRHDTPSTHPRLPLLSTTLKMCSYIKAPEKGKAAKAPDWQVAKAKARLEPAGCIPHGMHPGGSEPCLCLCQFQPRKLLILKAEQVTSEELRLYCPG